MTTITTTFDRLLIPAPLLVLFAVTSTVAIGPFAAASSSAFRAPCFTPVGFLGGNAPAAIGRDMDPALDWLCREQTEPGQRTSIPKGA